MIPVLDTLYRISEVLNYCARRFAALCFLGMLAVMMLQVIARYLLASPPFWTEELARWLMVWGGLLGASCGFHTRADPAMVHPPSESILRQKTQIVSRFIAAWVFFAPVLWYCWPFLARQIERTSEGLHISTAWMVSALPVAIVLILFHSLVALGGLLSPGIFKKEVSYAIENETELVE